MALTALTPSDEITVTALSPTFGAEIGGIDLTDLSPENIARVNDLLLEHGVLFFRDSMLDEEEHKALAQGFGTPSIFPLSRLSMKPGGDTPFMSHIIDKENDPPKADNWHTDVTWIPEPPKIAFLQAVEVPEQGGDTMWADLYAAYDSLSPIMQNFFEGLTVDHQVSPVIVDAARRIGGPELANLLLEKFPPVQHPLIRTHPETGRRALFVAGDFMIGIEGLEKQESQMILTWLHDYINNPNFHLRWNWTKGDLAIWDERRTNHRALSNHYPSYRHVRRCTVDGDKPYF